MSAPEPQRKSPDFWLHSTQFYSTMLKFQFRKPGFASQFSWVSLGDVYVNKTRFKIKGPLILLATEALHHTDRQTKFYSKTESWVGTGFL